MSDTTLQVSVPACDKTLRHTPSRRVVIGTAGIRNCSASNEGSEASACICRAESEGRKAEQVNSSVAERNASASTKYTTNRSERLVEELKARRFRQIFTYLDQVRT